jgi:hypothetical protein
MESAREDALLGDVSRIYVNADEYSGEYKDRPVETYEPHQFADEKVAKTFGHGGSDFYCMYHFIEKILGNPEADIIDIYEALDMGIVGLLAYRSVLNGGVPVRVPNLRNKEEREIWRNDTTCTDVKVAGDMLVPTFSAGTPDIPQEVYDHQAQLWTEECAKTEGTYRTAALSQGSKQ